MEKPELHTHIKIQICIPKEIKFPIPDSPIHSPEETPVSKFFYVLPCSMF